MRPRAIIIFEWLAWISIALGVLSIVLGWDRHVADSARNGRGPEATLALWMFVTLFNAGLLWLVAHRANVPARIVYILLTAIVVLITLAALIFLPGTGEALQRENQIINLARRVLDLASLWFLFRPDSRRWFRREGEVSPEIFS